MVYQCAIEKTPDGTTLRIQGILDGSLDFERQLGRIAGRLTVDLSGVRHMNSSAVIPWLQYFGGLKEKGTPFRFKGCPDATIQYFNLLPGFACGGLIESVVAPFFCGKCSTDFQIEVETTSLAKAIELASSQKCPSCGRSMPLDEDVSSFFACIR
jgi:anti-anti-sigma regulatory factor